VQNGLLLFAAFFQKAATCIYYYYTSVLMPEMSKGGILQKTGALFEKCARMLCIANAFY